ncbi:MAG: hypothetical protein NTY35_13150 [Planctomycetota bacterium]|nr:hypothetical protein [Planctomycetota bacterium]
MNGKLRILAVLLAAIPWLASSARSVSSADPRPEAAVVARLELEAPARSFVLRAVVPVPPGTWPRGDGLSPFLVRVPGAEPVRAQVDIVSRSPRGDADAIEIAARVELAGEVRPGARIGASVLRDEGAAIAGEPAVPASVQLLLDPAARGRIWLRARDVYGNLYAAELAGNPAGTGFGASRTLASGPWMRVRRQAATLMPVASPEGEAGTSHEGPPLPHLFGLHAYLREWAGEEAIGLDLRVHNGSIAGSRGTEPGEEVLGLVYFRSIELVLPGDWTAVADVRDPFLGEAYAEGPSRVVPIVARYPDGKLHLMGPQAQFERRLVLVKVGDERRARALSRFGGVAFPARGADLWSWTTPATANYFPQRDFLASLDFVRDGERGGKPAVRARLERDARDLRTALESGTARGWYVTAGVMGWAHPWFLPEQGGVGGEGIQFVDGHDTAYAASREGLDLLALRHRMNVCRQPEATYDRRGEIVGHARWLDAEGRIPFDYRTHGRVVIPAFRLPMDGGPAASEQVQEVVRRGLRPPYDAGEPFARGGQIPYKSDLLLRWWPHDDQHLVRYTKHAKALAWLANDPMAKDDLRLSAELFRLFVHESPHVPESWSPGLTLRIWEGIVAEHPHEGLPIGRDHAWGVDAMCAAYSLSDEAWRARERPWFDRYSRLLLEAAQPSGLVQRILSERLLDGTNRYTVTQAFESLFLVHAQRCLVESVYRGSDEPRRKRLEQLSVRAVEYLDFGPPWARQPAGWQPDPAHPTLFLQGPRAAIAISHNDERKTPPFSDARHWGANYLPADGLGGGVEITYPWAALDWASRCTDGGAEGAGLANRYLKRVLDCATPRASWSERLAEFGDGASNASTDNSGNWAGLVGRLQALGIR